ncbi:hypothetical protein QFC21_001101 [Naganishia friedmannii]|uniref:Uncharacterized protein n=1 Tax=Naganishia friedmannii TaxID=89922 RepID=A0ACC2W9B3_9TREE|nr:hypothetical protein QFC21_001101 [Naganishia friedmannii]
MITQVDFTINSPRDPLSFTKRRKWIITTVAFLFSVATNWNTGAYAIGEGSLQKDIGGTALRTSAGFGIYVWGFALFPLVSSGVSEDLGRRPLYVATGLLYWLFYFPIAKANNMGLLLAFRFMQGCMGSTGSTVVGGTLADIWPTSERGTKMSLLTLVCFLGNSVAPIAMSWVEARPDLGWRWIQWIQVIIFAVFLPFIMLIPETREAVILRRKAAKKRKESRKTGEQGKTEETVYLARSEVNKPPLIELIKISSLRPIWLLFTEPIVLFFSLWVAVAWGVFYALTSSIPLIFQGLYSFDTGRVGLVYLTLAIGTILGYLGNFTQEHLYRKNVATRGPEARLYAAMLGGICFAVGCFIYAWTSFPYVTYIAPCIGITVAVFGIFCIYLSVFNFLADSYTVYASSALAGQSCLRNLVGGAFTFFTRQLYNNLTPRWGSTLFGGLAAILAVIPFVAFFYGPQIRKGSKFAKTLAAEQERLREEGGASAPPMPVDSEKGIK